MKRLFIAIGLPTDVQKKLSDFQREMKSFAKHAKWARVENIHLTLKFLGKVQDERIAGIASAMRTISTATFPVHVKGCGFFPNSRRPNVFWTGVNSAELNSLQQKVEDVTAQFGFEKEKRPFSPHLTLARFRAARGFERLIQEAERRKDASISEFNASHFSLYESILLPQGAQHHVIETVSLT